MHVVSVPLFATFEYPIGQSLQDAEPARSVYFPAAEQAMQWFSSESCGSPVPAFPAGHNEHTADSCELYVPEVQSMNFVLLFILNLPDEQTTQLDCAASSCTYPAGHVEHRFSLDLEKNPAGQFWHALPLSTYCPSEQAVSFREFCC